MTLQNVARYFEEPLAAVCAGLNLPLYFDNQFRGDHDVDDERAYVEITFNQSSTPGICEPPEYIRGAIVIVALTPKFRGAGRARELGTELLKYIQGFNADMRPVTEYGVKGGTSDVFGPSHGSLSDQPVFWTRVSASFWARYTDPTGL
jgi:hypothetical protein